MRRIIFFLVAAAIVVAIAWFIAGLPGHVTAQFGATTVEAATPVAVLALLILLALLYLVLRILFGLIRGPRALGAWGSRRRRRKGDVAVTRTLLALAAGEKADARREAGRARRLLGDTPQTLLLSAEAGRLSGRDDEAEAMFRKLTDRKDAAFLGYRGLLRQAMARQDWAQAASLARQAEAAHPGAAWLQEERAQLAIRTGNWAEALELFDASTPKAALATAAAAVAPDSGRALRLARQAWKDDASLPPAALAYASRLREDGRESRAQAVVRHTWALTPHPDLAAFALAPTSDRLARVQAAQALTRANPEHVESRLLLARVSLEAGLTGEARHHAEAARDAGVNQRRPWLLLAEIEEEERGDTEEGRQAQRDALRQAAQADPDPAWRCTACHAQQTEWHAACPVCAAAGTLRWTASAGTSYPVPAVIE
jgi:HemY protein